MGATVGVAVGPTGVSVAATIVGLPPSLNTVGGGAVEVAVVPQATATKAITITHMNSQYFITPISYTFPLAFYSRFVRLV